MQKAIKCEFCPNFKGIGKKFEKIKVKENENKCCIVHNSIFSNETQEILILGRVGNRKTAPWYTVFLIGKKQDKLL